MEELPYLLYRFYNTTLKEKLIKLEKDKSLKGKITPGKWEYPLKNLQFCKKKGAKNPYTRTLSHRNFPSVVLVCR